MRVLSLLSFLALASLIVPAQAVMRGQPSRHPDGLRQSVVWIENSEGELCSGALIRPDLVLTAAHCMMDQASYRVVALNRAFKPQRLRVVAAAVHPQFMPGTTPRTQPGVDLAILKLERPLTDGFVPFNLSAIGQLQPGERVTIAGYGIVGEGQRGSARTLRQTDLVSLGPVKISNRVHIVADENRLAQTTGAGACRGDSGGPILVPTQAGYQLLGIVSWSSGALRSARNSACGGLTAVTPVSDHLAWINQGVASLDGLQGHWARQ
ncbi:S1 family peptidase [Microvirga pudoricolor]|uniref:S1 family peptidase n=1 Tax=Microvirga pudoricolor TaxID=2778729 RepID=UPI001951FB1A|nr:trypsin-like serine protease [Microvirga pudoricolor]MBM6592381.1 trypsin-like serine protease [Microvirga pudoricolor]